MKQTKYAPYLRSRKRNTHPIRGQRDEIRTLSQVKQTKCLAYQGSNRRNAHPIKGETDEIPTYPRWNRRNTHSIRGRRDEKRTLSQVKQTKCLAYQGSNRRNTHLSQVKQTKYTSIQKQRNEMCALFQTKGTNCCRAHDRPYLFWTRGRWGRQWGGVLTRRFSPQIQAVVGQLENKNEIQRQAGSTPGSLAFPVVRGLRRVEHDGIKRNIDIIPFGAHCRMFWYRSVWSKWGFAVLTTNAIGMESEPDLWSPSKGIGIVHLGSGPVLRVHLIRVTEPKPCEHGNAPVSLAKASDYENYSGRKGPNRRGVGITGFRNPLHERVTTK